VTFEPEPEYPLENQRDYGNPVNQDKLVTGGSRAGFDPPQLTSNGQLATEGPLVAGRLEPGSSKRVVYAGNGRKGILDRVYAGNPEGVQRYLAQMRADAPGLGLDPAELDGMKEPVLIRELADSELASPQAKQNAIADFNVSPTAAVTPAEQAITDSRRVSASTLEDVAARLDKQGPAATLGEVLAGKSGGEVLSKLVDDGVMSKQERATFLHGDGPKQGELTDAGKERISQLNEWRRRHATGLNVWRLRWRKWRTSRVGISHRTSKTL
jgi:hypothetical protein